MSQSKQGISKGIKRGLDYTPLFKFLLSRVGHKWASVHSEAVSRLETQEPIYWMVSIDREKTYEEFFWLGQYSYYSVLYVDEDGILQVVNPEINHTTIEPDCGCCTHTFNGIKFTKKYRPWWNSEF